MAMKIAGPLKELSFIVKLVAAIVFASLLTFGLLYFYMDKDVGNDYGTAFRAIESTYRWMNFYIANAVLVQLIASSLIVFSLALYYSHKIAGPIYRLKITIQQFLKGRKTEEVSFRKTDFCHDVAVNFTVLLSFLEKRRKKFQEARRVIEQADVLEGEKKQEIVMEVEDILKALRAERDG